jgi:cell division protein FtsN
MPKIEPVYEPRDHDMGAYDGDDGDMEQEEEGSRLPLLIVIGLLVLAAFGGVVWLAYQHGVERGMRDAPRSIAGQETPSSQQDYNKIYQKPASSDEDTANDDTAPASPTPAFKSQAAPAAATPAPSTPAPSTPAPSKAAASAPGASSVHSALTASAPAPNVSAKATKTVAATPVAPPPVPKSAQPETVATKPPAKLVTETAPVKAEPKPADTTPAPSTPSSEAPAASGGDYVLQIGAYKSEDEAASAWKSYTAKHSVAAGRSDSIQKVDLGAKGTWYRLRIAGFANKDAAEALCTKLKADGGDCIPAKN